LVERTKEGENSKELSHTIQEEGEFEKYLISYFFSCISFFFFLVANMRSYLKYAMSAGVTWVLKVALL
jgi:hypothetical protein